MLAFGCTWGPVEVRGQKSFVAFAKKEICRDVALSKTTTAHEEEAPVESACSQMLAELAAAMEKDEKAEMLENESNASDLQSRTPEPGTPPIQQEQLQTSDQGDPAQQFPDQTPGHASFYGGGTAPAYSDHNPGGETPSYGGDNCPAHQEDHEEEEASNPEWPFDSHIWLSSHICIVCNREFQFLGDLYSHQDEDRQDLFLPLSEGEEIDDRSTYALRIQGQVGCRNDPYKHPAPTAIIAMINEGGRG